MPLMRDIIKARLERATNTRPTAPTEKFFKICRYVAKEFETRIQDKRDFAKLMIASSFKDLKGELLSFMTLSFSGSEKKNKRAKISCGIFSTHVFGIKSLQRIFAYSLSIRMFFWYISNVGSLQNIPLIILTAFRKGV